MPGKNAWADDLDDAVVTQVMDLTLRQREKRRRVEDEADVEMDVQVNSACQAQLT